MTTPDDASPRVVLRYLRDSVAKWEPNARLLANARASDILRALDDALSAGTCGTCAHFEKLGPSSRGLCRNSQSIAVDSHVTPDDGCRLGYEAKATPTP